jgi:hypothetical protein
MEDMLVEEHLTIVSQPLLPVSTVHCHVDRCLQQDLSQAVQTCHHIRKLGCHHSLLQ